VANSSIKVVGRLDPAEAGRPEYGFLPPSQRARATLAAAEFLDERVSGTDHSCRVESFQAAHRPQPRLQTPMISFDGVVRVLLAARRSAHR
jgi:hypothetical protein